MNKYQIALNKIINHKCYEKESSCWDYVKTIYKEETNTLQELVDKETPLTPTYKDTYIGKEQYLDKDCRMLYHCPKCDCIVFPIGRCDKCNQNLDWNKYFIIEGNTYYKRSDNDE